MLILAGNKSECDRYTKSAHYISDINDIQGFRDTTLLLVGNWMGRTDIDMDYLGAYCKAHNITVRDTTSLTDRERQIVDREYEKHKYDNICPHTTDPRQLKSLCKRCVKLDILSIHVYQMPSGMGGDWAASSAGKISDGFKSRHDAEEWALKQHYPITAKDGTKYRNIGSYIDSGT